MAMRRMLWRHSLLLLLLTGCATYNAYTQLPAEEQGLYCAYSHLMTLGQWRTYPALPTAAERTASTRQVDAAQRLKSLPAEERTAVLGGHPFVGMNRPALLRLWGEPYWR
jgi:hypothetical protein